MILKNAQVTAAEGAVIPAAGAASAAAGAAQESSAVSGSGGPLPTLPPFFGGPLAPFCGGLAAVPSPGCSCSAMSRCSSPEPGSPEMSRGCCLAHVPLIKLRESTNSLSTRSPAQNQALAHGIGADSSYCLHWRVQYEHSPQQISKNCRTSNRNYK